MGRRRPGGWRCRACVAGKAAYCPTRAATLWMAGRGDVACRDELEHEEEVARQEDALSRGDSEDLAQIAASVLHGETRLTQAGTQNGNAACAAGPRARRAWRMLWLGPPIVPATPPAACASHPASATHAHPASTRDASMPRISPRVTHVCHTISSSPSSPSSLRLSGHRQPGHHHHRGGDHGAAARLCHARRGAGRVHAGGHLCALLLLPGSAGQVPEGWGQGRGPEGGLQQHLDRLAGPPRLQRRRMAASCSVGAARSTPLPACPALPLPACAGCPS